MTNLAKNTGELTPKGLYIGTNATTIQGYTEANNKNGTGWEASREVQLGLNQKAYSVIKVGDVYTIDLKARVLGATGIGVIGRIYEIQESDVSFIGQPDKWYNMRFDITTQPDVLLYAGSAINFITPVNQLAILENKRGADIIVRTNTQNQAKGVITQPFSTNRILYQSKLALLELESLDAGQFISARLEIYEGFLDLPV